MFIQTETTPNPNALKFFPGVALHEGPPGRWIRESENLARAPLAGQLLALPSVTEVLITRDYISVRKDPDGDWANLKIFVLSVIADFVEFGWPAVTGEAEPSVGAGGRRWSQAEREIMDVLDSHVRPAVARDGGDVRLRRYETGSHTVRIELLGACGGCPSARITLKQGIERILTERLAFVHHVEEFQEGVMDADRERTRRLRAMARNGGTSRPRTRFFYDGRSFIPPDL